MPPPYERLGFEEIFRVPDSGPPIHVDLALGSHRIGFASIDSSRGTTVCIRASPAGARRSPCGPPTSPPNTRPAAAGKSLEPPGENSSGERSQGGLQGRASPRRASTGPSHGNDAPPH